VLISLLDKLRQSSPGCRRGNLSLVKWMTDNGGA
jgi:hypothetical protein